MPSPYGFFQQQAGLLGGSSDVDPYMDEAEQRALLQGPQAPQAPANIAWQGNVGGRNITQYGDTPLTDEQMMARLQQRSDFRNTGVVTNGQTRAMDDAAYWAAVHPNATPEQIQEQERQHAQYVESGIGDGKKGWRGWALNHPLGVIASFAALAAGGAGLAGLAGGGAAGAGGAGATGSLGSSIGSGLSSGFTSGIGAGVGQGAGASLASAAGATGAGAAGAGAGYGAYGGFNPSSGLGIFENGGTAGMAGVGGGNAGSLVLQGGAGTTGLGQFGQWGQLAQDNASQLGGLLGGGEDEGGAAVPFMGGQFGGAMGPNYGAGPGYTPPIRQQARLPTNPGMPITPQGRRARNFLGSTIWM